MNKIVVTTSWDDGCKSDFVLGNLLKKYNLKGTLYISPENRELKEEQRLTKGQIILLEQDFEIGAHTMTHPRLSTLGDDKAREEIINSKEFLESITGHEIESFCYPGGDFNNAHKQMVKDSGFNLARTVRRFSLNVGQDHFALPTTIHAYRHWSDVFSILKFSRGKNFFKYYLNWDQLAIAMFDKVQETGGVFHIWGHSWEIDKNNDWERLENVFKYIANRKGVSYVTNGKLYE